MIIDKLFDLLIEAIAAFANATDTAAIEAARVKYIGANGALKTLITTWKEEPLHLATPTALSSQVNAVRQLLEKAFEDACARMKKVAPITEDWLRASGFRWHEMPRCIDKHWTLGLGGTVRGDRRAYSNDDLMLELTKADKSGPDWFVWIRADYAGRYSRLIHVRYMQRVDQVIALIQGLTGLEFRQDHCLYGNFHRPDDAQQLIADADRLHERQAREWGERAERDTSETDTAREGKLGAAGMTVPRLEEK